ncbi:MAG: hypothetical protein AAB365_01545 [Patescibacteria group bacterium]
MNTESFDISGLLQRVQNYVLDDPSSPSPFSRRLASDNGWTHEYALRALEEYKRFTFLSVVAGHPVTPSDEVDQAWHLHMIYTEEYWGNFCPNILGRPLHHGPSKGGRKESDKFEDWYAKTKSSYERFFHHPPPADIWPSHEIRFKREFMRVDVREHVIIRKEDFPVISSLAVLMLETITRLTKRKAHR